MAYMDIAEMAESPTLRARIQAAATKENVANAAGWVASRMSEFAASPGWDEAWASADAANPDADHGADDTVITDAEILSAVQAMSVVGRIGL